jgi:hypothetical protein
MFKTMLARDYDLPALMFEIEFSTLKTDAKFNFGSSFFLNFESRHYEIKNCLGNEASKHYGEQLSDEEINKILKIEAERHFKAIEDKIKQA